MNGLLILLCCIEILGALLCGAQTSAEAYLDLTTGANVQDDKSTSTSMTVPAGASTEMTETSSSTSTQSTAAVAQSTKSPTTSPSPDQQSSILDGMMNSKDFLPVLLVTGGLIIACTILLLSTLLLACKVCHLTRRIKALGSSEDMILSCDISTGTAKKDESKSEPQPKETSVLMADVDQTQEEMGNGASKEESEKVDGQVAEEKEKEVGDGAKSEEALATPATSAENSSSSKPQGEATYSQPTKATADSTSEGTEEPKDVK